MSFRKLVIKNKVKQPNQVGFSLKKWKECFEGCENTSREDESLYKAGIWFHGNFNFLRNEFSQVMVPEYARSDLIMAFIGSVNRDYIIAKKQVQEYARIDDNTYVANKAIEARLTTGIDGHSVDAEGFVSGIVETLKFTLSEVLKIENKPKNSSSKDVLDFIRKRSNLAASYNLHNSLWNNMVWESWLYEEHEDCTYFFPSNVEWFKSYTVGLHRFYAILGENIQRNIMMWEDLPKQFREIIRKREFSSIKRKNGVFTLRNITPPEELQFPPRGLGHSLAAETIYWQDLLIEPLDEFEGLCIRDLQSLWQGIQSIVELIVNKLDKNIIINDIDDLLTLCPRINKNSLIKGLAEKYSKPVRSVKKFVDSLFFEGKHKDDIWLTPFIDVGNGSIGLIIPAILDNNNIRLIEKWMSIGGLDLGKRGDLFEIYVVDFIKSSLSNSKYMSENRVVGSRNFYYTNKNFEELDLVWQIGDTVVIGELKCILYACEAIEKHNYLQTLEGGCRQLDRKIKVVNENREAFIKDFGLSCSSNFKIVPIVVTNMPLASGYICQNISVVDLNIIDRYIDGFQEHFSIADPKTRKFTPSLKVVFHNNLEEAARKVENYFRKPNTVEILKESYSRRFEAFTSFNKEEKSMAFMRGEIEISAEKMKEAIKKLR
ncbi:hypothetical protein [Halobacteriovorax sp. RT-2-4]|uniref:hypothetical protein n=1 Tax=unclassified Halobacteriovorax TaxID=2639665 RepID=UPI003999A22C